MIENLRGKSYCLLGGIRVWKKKNYVTEGKRGQKIREKWLGGYLEHTLKN